MACKIRGTLGPCRSSLADHWFLISSGTATIDDNFQHVSLVFRYIYTQPLEGSTGISIIQNR